MIFSAYRNTEKRIMKAPPEAFEKTAHGCDLRPNISALIRSRALLIFMRIIPLYFENSAARRFRLSGIAATPAMPAESLSR